jgi:hypothetical protein
MLDREATDVRDKKAAQKKAKAKKKSKRTGR